MAFIRNREEEKTGYQNGSPLMDCYDNACDFIMVYRLDDSTAERIEEAKKAGYVVHFMTGISWGHYLDYLNGDYDGCDHWDEAQTDRWGNQILHSPNVPYMVPTVAFADYITGKLKKIVDMGVEAIHVEEPEFWDRAGYSEAFKREYYSYYKSKWIAPHSDVDARFKCAKLKQYLYTRTIDRVSSALKEYSLKKYGKPVRFYVPTHSILNYTQWKIVSPEGKLADIPCVDGCIAQVWTGTAREKNWYQGKYAERTFETAFLEYGVMQELVKNTGRRMWFLHDPIEDNPIFDWDDYRKNYFCTVSASLLHPAVNDYEICPWPNRVFTGKYPRDSINAIPIPPEYATILNNTFQTLGDIPAEDVNGMQVGILMADAQLYQRTYPDSEFSVAEKEVTGTVLTENHSLIDDFKTMLSSAAAPDRETLLKYMQSATFPAFYGLALPLLKYGTPVRPVLLDNVRRYPSYLDDYRILVVSYEYLKPEYPDMNLALAEWVKRGGTLIYIGDGSDPYHKISSWWTGKYETPADHLFEMLGLDDFDEKLIASCGKGAVGIWRVNPCMFSFSKAWAEIFRSFFRDVLLSQGRKLEEKNNLTLRRGSYLIAAVMEESVSSEPLVLKGQFADMYSPDFSVIKEKVVVPGESCLLHDLALIPEPVAVIGSSVRINSCFYDNCSIRLSVRGASDFQAFVRMKTPVPVVSVTIDGKVCEFDDDAESRTVLLRFNSIAGDREILISL